MTDAPCIFVSVCRNIVSLTTMGVSPVNHTSSGVGVGATVDTEGIWQATNYVYIR